MNGLLRDSTISREIRRNRDLPKGLHTGEELAQIAAEVNQRPRKTLGWRRPAELLISELAAV